MKKSFLAVAAIAATMSASATANLGTDFVTFSGEFGVDSEYLYQGFSPTDIFDDLKLDDHDVDPSIYGDVRMHFYNIDAVSVGLEARTLDVDDNNLLAIFDVTHEGDITVNEALGYKLGVEYNVMDSDHVDNFPTFFGALTSEYAVRGYPAKGELGVNYSTNFLIDDVDNTYVFLDYDVNVMPSVWVDLHVGKSFIDVDGASSLDDDAVDYSVGLTYSQPVWSATVAYADTDVSGDDGRVVGNLAYKF